MVINISSRLGSLTRMVRGDYRDESHSYAYRIAKAAQNMLTACMIHDTDMAGILVAAVHPGRISTGLSKGAGQASPTEQAEKLFRCMKAGEIRHGTFLNLDGGEMEW